jgi:hypothetical protein
VGVDDGQIFGALVDGSVNTGLAAGYLIQIAGPAQINFHNHSLIQLVEHAACAGYKDPIPLPQADISKSRAGKAKEDQFLAESGDLLPG